MNLLQYLRDNLAKVLGYEVGYCVDNAPLTLTVISFDKLGIGKFHMYGRINELSLEFKAILTGSSMLGLHVYDTSENIDLNNHECQLQIMRVFSKCIVLQGIQESFEGSTTEVPRGVSFPIEFNIDTPVDFSQAYKTYNKRSRS